MGARKKYARRIIGLKLLHIRKCASETRYSAIFKSCFPPHNVEFDECVGGRGEGRGGEGEYISYRAIERATCEAQQKFYNRLASPYPREEDFRL